MGLWRGPEASSICSVYFEIRMPVQVTIQGSQKKTRVQKQVMRITWNLLFGILVTVYYANLVQFVHLEIIRIFP